MNSLAKQSLRAVSCLKVSISLKHIKTLNTCGLSHDVPTSLTHALDLTQRKVPVLLGFRVPPTTGMPGLRLPRAKRNETKH